MAIADSPGALDLSSSTGGLGTVVRIVMHEVPEPNESVAWEQLLELRRDPEMKAKIVALRRWMSDVATKAIEPDRIQEELEFLLHDYERYMRLQKIKINKGMLETILTVTAEAAENIVKLKWGNLAKASFPDPGAKNQFIAS